MGRLSTFAKNRILNLRFQKSYRIKQIASTLLQEDNIKVSRKSISTFLKKYIETKSIHDKPRSGRNKKLTAEEINLIGEVTRLNRDITAPKIKEYLNLNVSTYTILRASKLFEWNKLNPNSNEAKKAAALERQLKGETKKRRSNSKSKNKSSKTSSLDSTATDDNEETTDATKENSPSKSTNIINIVKLENEPPVNPNLNLLTETDILQAKNVSSSPMVFATKILYKIFRLDELLGHNVSGKTFNKFIKNKKALDEKRINYIRWLVENHFEASNKEELWKSCRTAINKSIRNNEIKGQQNQSKLQQVERGENECKDLNIELQQQQPIVLTTDMINLQPNMSIFQITNDIPPNLDEIQADPDDIDEYNHAPTTTSIITLTDTPEFIADESKSSLDLSKTNKYDFEDEEEEEEEEEEMEEHETISILHSENHKYNLNLLNEHEIAELKSYCCSPMIFATKVLVKVFSKEELIGHNVSGKTFHKNLRNKKQLDEDRINYIKYLVEKNFGTKKIETVWKSCRKAINRIIRNYEIKESKLIKSIEEDMDEDSDDQSSNLDENQSSLSSHA